MRKIVLLSILSLLITPSFTSAQSFTLTEVPEWVESLEIPEETKNSKYDISSGFYLTLANYQINLQKEAVFNREVRNVLTYSGVTNASQLSVTFDTSYQHLEIHHLYIWRKGEKLDYTNKLSFEILNNEHNLSEGIYNGTITAYELLEDVRKGDLIDFQYTLFGENPIFEKERYYLIPFETSNPIDLYAVRFLYAKGDKYNYNCINCDSIDFSIDMCGVYSQISMKAKDLKAIDYENNMTSWTLPDSYFLFSSLKSWKEVNSWAQGVFALEEPQNLKSVFDEIFTGEESKDEQIDKIINFVQDEIRYMGIESGIGSIKPYAPQKVIKQRFGDCKDKSLLLVTLLKNIGVEQAYPALVNVKMQHELDRLQPSNQLFNHCIAMFKHNNKEYWIDPTISLQGGSYKNMGCYDFGKALVVGLPADSLQTIELQNSDTRIEMKEEITVHSFTEPSVLKTKSTRYGMMADRRRSFLEYYSVNDLINGIMEEMRKVYPSVKMTSDLRVEDDPEQNELTMIYNYEIDEFWQDGEEMDDPAFRNYRLFRFEPTELYGYLEMTNCEDRKYDYALNYPMDMQYQITFNFPQEMLLDDTYKEYDTDVFFFSEKVEQISRKSFQVNYRYQTKSKQIEAEKVEAICKQMTEIRKKLPLVVFFPK